MTRRVRNRPGLPLTLCSAVALLFGAAACGSDASGSDVSPGVSSSATPEEDGSNDTLTSSDSVDSAASADVRLVSTPMGEVEVPAEPQRIVVLWGATLASVVELGFDPVGSVGRDGDNSSLAPYLPDDYPLDQLEVVSEFREVNLEAVAAIEPDLILGGNVPHLSEVYDLLSEIAPTALLSWEGTTSWRTMLIDVADVLGVPDRAEQAVDDYEAHVAEVRSAVGIDESPRLVSLVRIQSADELRIETPESFSGQILADVGFDRPENQMQPDADADYISLSLERIPDLDAPTIIVLHYFDDSENSAAWDQIRSTGLWQALPAVQSGDVITADFTDWSSSNYYAAHRVLDDIEMAFAS